jgi:predicted secreted protein
MAETRHARAGEPHVVVLPGLGAAGYQWTAQAPPGVRVERVETAGPAAGDVAAGQSVDAVFEVVADSPGVYSITFEHRRPWERDVAPVETREFELHVEA